MCSVFTTFGDHAMKCQCIHNSLSGSAPAQLPKQRFTTSEAARQHASKAQFVPNQLPVRRKRCSEQVVAAAPERSDISTRQAAHKPSSAQTANTIVDIVAHGTLCTIGEDGVPLGTYTNYVLDDRGMPVLRLRADAVHTANLRRSPKCRLFVQPGTVLSAVSNHTVRCHPALHIIKGAVASHCPIDVSS